MNAPAQDLAGSLALVRTLGLVAMVCGLLIAVSQQATAPAIAAHQKAVVERAVRALVPAARSVQAYDVGANGVKPAAGEPAPGATRIYAARDGSGRLVAIVAEGAARGYADLVRVLYAYDPGCQCTRGMRVVSMRETPGIGDKVLKDAAFIANFAGLDLALDSNGRALAHAVTTVRHGSQRNPWEIDAIAGATVTSRAVGRAINDSARALLPQLYPHLDKMNGAAP